MQRLLWMLWNLKLLLLALLLMTIGGVLNQSLWVINVTVPFYALVVVATIYWLVV